MAFYHKDFRISVFIAKENRQCHYFLCEDSDYVEIILKDIKDKYLDEN